MSRSKHEQLVHFLSDMYSVEQQALAQLVAAPESAREPSLAAMFRTHHVETERQAELVRQRLEFHGGSPSAVKDAVMKLGGKGFLLFAKVQPETPGRLVVHSYAYEAMEWAGYEMLWRFAERAGDTTTANVAKAIGAEEREMMGRLEGGFDAAEHISHSETLPAELPGQVHKHLANVHAFESQAVQLLKKSDDIGGSPLLNSMYGQMLNQVYQHANRVEQLLDTLDADISTLKDAAMAIGGLNWGLFFQAQSDTPAKLAAFVYAFLHLEIGGYELLKRTAYRAAENNVVAMCERTLVEKRRMADELSAVFDEAIEATLTELSENR